VEQSNQQVVVPVPLKSRCTLRLLTACLTVFYQRQGKMATGSPCALCRDDKVLLTYKVRFSSQVNEGLNVKVLVLFKSVIGLYHSEFIALYNL